MVAKSNRSRRVHHGIETRQIICGRSECSSNEFDCWNKVIGRHTSIADRESLAFSLAQLVIPEGFSLGSLARVVIWHGPDPAKLIVFSPIDGQGPGFRRAGAIEFAPRERELGHFGCIDSPAKSSGVRVLAWPRPLNERLAEIPATNAHRVLEAIMRIVNSEQESSTTANSTPLSEASRPIRKLSVLMPVYNECWTLREIVARVLASRVGVAIELIIVDDASTDGSWEVIQELAARDSRIKIVRHEKNRGKGAAIRTAIPHITGEVSIIQDADLEYDPQEYSVAAGADPGRQSRRGVRLAFCRHSAARAVLLAQPGQQDPDVGLEHGQRPESDRHGERLQDRALLDSQAAATERRDVHVRARADLPSGAVGRPHLRSADQLRGTDLRGRQENPRRWTA